MRFTLTLSSIAMILAFVAIPAEACALPLDWPLDGQEYPHCPSYDLIAAGEGGASFEANAFGQFLLTIPNPNSPDAPLYQTFDEPSLYGQGEPFTFSLWTYQEGNGLPGLQRGDDVCNNTPPGHFSDTTLC